MQAHNPKIVTDGLVFNLDTLGGRGPNKIITKPTQIDGCVLWLDADDKEAIVESSGAVSTWLDKSGNGNHASQSTGSKQPAYSDSGMNGRGIITFDASTYDTLNAGDSSTIDVAGSITIITVSRIADDLASGSDINTVHKDNQYSCRIQDVENGTITWADSQSWSYSGFGYHSAGLVPSKTAIVTQMRDSSIATECSGYVNGKQVYNKSHGSGDITTTGYDCYIGSYNNGGGWWDGQINEVLIYNRALSADERQQVELYLSRKWNIPIEAQPRTHTNPANAAVSNTKYGKLDQVGNSLYFVGGPNTTGGYKDYINCGNVLGNGTTYSSGSPFSYEVWAKDHGSETSWKTLIGSSSYAQIFFYANNSIRFQKNGGGNGGSESLQYNSKQLHEWYHIVGTFEGGTSQTYSGDISTGPDLRKLYVNGEYVDSDKQTFYGGNITNNYIGSYHANGLERFPGELAVARIYNKELSHAEIKQNYNAQKTRIDAMPKIARPQNLSLYYDAGIFESYRGTGSGDTVYDLSGSGVDGTIIGATYNTTLPENDMGKSFTFDGSNDKINFSSITLGNGPFTLLFWVRFSGGGNYHLFSNDSGGPVTFRAGLSSGRVYFESYGTTDSSGNTGQTATWRSYASSTTLSNETWYQLAWVQSGSGETVSINMYYDEVEDATTKYSHTTNGAPCDSIGASWAGYFAGDVALAMIYADNALSHEEIKQNFNYFKPRYGK